MRKEIRKEKKFTRKLSCCMVLVFLPFIHLLAQEEQERHEISVSGGAGISTLNYTLNTGDYKFGIGGDVGLDYSYFINDNIGIRSGIGISFYNSKATVGSVSDSYMTNDGQESFEFRSKVDNYQEKQHLTLINIPLMVQFQHPVFCCNGHLFYLALGGKVGFPVRSTFESSDATCITSGYYEQYNVEMYDPAFRGFGTFTVKGSEKNLDLKTAWMLSAEIGMKWMIAESYSFYTGVYCDYGLNDVAEDHNRQFLIYDQNHPADFSTNSVLHARYTQNGSTESFTSKVVPATIGLKLRFTFRVPD